MHSAYKSTLIGDVLDRGQYPLNTLDTAIHGHAQSKVVEGGQVTAGEFCGLFEVVKTCGSVVTDLHAGDAGCSSQADSVNPSGEDKFEPFLCKAPILVGQSTEGFDRWFSQQAVQEGRLWSHNRERRPRWCLRG